MTSRHNKGMGGRVAIALRVSVHPQDGHGLFSDGVTHRWFCIWTRVCIAAYQHRYSRRGRPVDGCPRALVLDKGHSHVVVDLVARPPR